MIPFVKMHGIGNDYVYLDAVNSPGVEARFQGPEGADLIRRMSDRHRGIGSDGVILVCRPRTQGGAHVRMRMFNADGSESEMCGNGIRCVAKFAHDRLGIDARPMNIETGRGVLSIDSMCVNGKLVEATVDMGEPILDPGRLPMDASRVRHAVGQEWELVSDRGEIRFVPISMGNPHITIFTLEPSTFELDRLGPVLERHQAFPSRTNVHVAHAAARNHVVMRTWERGAGLTQACGTGACAVVVAGVLTDRLERTTRATLPGGDLVIRWDERSNHVLMTGPATEVFDGVWPD